MIHVNVGIPARRMITACDREVIVMPYASSDDLPAAVRHHLPPHAQDIYREAVKVRSTGKLLAHDQWHSRAE